MKNFGKIIAAIAVVMLIAACVTTKKKGAEVSAFKKGYHNLTSKYNYWFNADELFYGSIDTLNKRYKDNYNQLLPIYPYMVTDGDATKADMDNVVKKAAKGIGLHRVSDWADDCYTLMGQAQFVKHDFETAENTFQYIKTNYDPKNKPKIAKGKKPTKKKASSGKKKKKKKISSRKKKRLSAKKKKKAAKAKKEADKKAKTGDKDAKPEEPLVTGTNPYKTKNMKRTSAYPLAMIWYGRTLTEREKYDEAEFLFRELSDDPWFPVTLKADLSMAEANNWIKQKRYDRAIAPLQVALDNTSKKKTKARLSYILAQLYEMSGNYQASYAALDVVLHSSPVYEMEFNARLHQTVAGWANKSISSKEANNTLERMVKDDKNKEYLDQVYYAMAQIALADGAKKDAIAYLQQSLAHNQTNTLQRSESYLKLADLYFEEEDFVAAKSYYDSTLTVLPNTDERYQRAKDYANNLTEIARLIQVIAANDSIVRVFYMDDAQRKDLAKSIKKQREAEAAAAAAKAAAASDKAPANATPPAFAGAGIKPSTFYFYNDAFVKKGKKDFNRVWGDRKLEDNWRRSSRISSGGPIDDIAAAKSDSSKTAEDVDVSDIFKGLPGSEAELAVLHASTYEAMYKLGTLFRDKLQNNKRCSTTLEDMQTRYTDYDKYEKETWYYCYLAFNDLGNPTRAKYYLDKLVDKYPNSPYARAISDPNFMNANKEREHELNKYYEDAYVQFQKGNYQDAFTRCEDAPKKFGATNELMPKFALLGALCVGNLQGNEAYCRSLSEVIARYPESAEATRAKEIARLLACKGFEVQEEKKPSNSADTDNQFTLDDDKLHYFLVVLSGDVRLEDVKNSVSDYNRENHRNDNLRISNIFLGTDTNTPIVVIRKFDNRDLAMKYYKEVATKNDFLGESDKKKYNKEFFAVTQENYRRILKNRSLDGYREFFNDNYLK